MPNYFLFRSSRKTYLECVQRMLVGQQSNIANDVLSIVQNDIIFIHYTGRNLPINEQFIEGPYFAISSGRENIVPEAWNGEFPFQVKIEKRGNIARISQETFSDFSLRYSYLNTFFPFKIPNIIGSKLMNEFGIEIKVSDISHTSIDSWNVIDNLEIDYRLRYEAKYRCEDGHYVRSRMEVIIDNWLFSHNITHAYEKKVLNLKMLCDFYIKKPSGKEIFIEAWGLNDERYIRRKNEKIQLYKDNNLELIQIDDNILYNLDDYFSILINI